MRVVRVRGHSSTRSERGFRSVWLSWREFGPREMWWPVKVSLPASVVFDFVSGRFVDGFVVVVMGVVIVPIHILFVVSFVAL